MKIIILTLGKYASQNSRTDGLSLVLASTPEIRHQKLVNV